MSESKQEMAPPWEVFPTYERYTIGWRMGNGEQYRYDWYNFIKKIPKDFENRLAYLRRHRPAPLNWGYTVYTTLYPDAKIDHDDWSEENLVELLKLRIVEHDAAYKTWLNVQEKIVWPWLLSGGPEEIARYRTREFWFFSRQLKTEREAGNIKISEIPKDWQLLTKQIQTGQMGDIDPDKGLLTLAQLLCTGSLKAPWTLGLSIDEFDDSFEMDMGYVDAFRLWIMCSFDDDLLLGKILQDLDVPSEWKEWIDEQCDF